MIAAYPILNRMFSLPRLVRLFDARTPETRAPEGMRERLNRLMDALLRRTLQRDYCLPRSLILFHFCRKWGYTTQIHLGLMKKGDEAFGHAWVSVAGEPFAEREDPDGIYTTFLVYPEQEPA